MQNTGAELKKAREQQNLSLNEVSMSTKINARVLEAMEENVKEKLPAKPFLRGFVKTYAEFLKLDSDQILKMFEDDLAPKPKVIEKPIEETVEPKKEEKKLKPEKKKRERKKSLSPKAANLKLPFLKEATITKQIFLVVFLVILIFMTIFVKDIVEKYQTEKEKAMTTPVQKQLEPIPENTESKKIEPSKTALENTNKTNKKKVSEPEKDTKPEAKKQVQATAQKPQPEVKKTPPAESNTAPNETKKQVAKETKEQTKASEEKKPAVTKGTKQEIILEAMDAITVSAVIDGEKEVNIKLAPGKVHVFKGNKIKLNYSDAGSVNVINNGRDQGVPGNLGQSKTVTYP